jgi:SAM-dependent methyltransferase
MTDSKAAEKEYLSRSGSLAWEQVKPFSPAATDTLRESLRLMHDFAVAVSALDATPNHRILDLGAGSCWTAEWLSRLNLRVTAIDIAFDMLRVGRGRVAGLTTSLVGADLEQLPFRDRSFDRALCLNALHHLPRPADALREISRVLDDNGRLVLVEPGSGHASADTSREAVRAYGVLEQELEATKLMALCRAAGFATVVVRPLSYMTGEIELTLDELSRWRSWTRTMRPVRAGRKMWRAVLEMFGLRKDGVLLEEAMSMWTSRVLMRHLGEQSVVVAHKQKPSAVARDYRAAIALQACRVENGRLTCDLSVTNVGNLTWRARAVVGRVQIGAQLLDDRKALINRDFARVALPDDVTAGGTCGVKVVLSMPSDASWRYLKVDLVAEGRTWFEDEGSEACVIDRRTL